MRTLVIHKINFGPNPQRRLSVPVLYDLICFTQSKHTHTPPCKRPQIWVIFSAGKEERGGGREGELLLISLQDDKDQSLCNTLTHTHKYTLTRLVGCDHKGRRPSSPVTPAVRARRWLVRAMETLVVRGGTRVNSGPRLPLLLCQTLVGE